MPSRVIRGEINASRSLANVSMLADLTFRALLVAADDFGRLEADPLMLKAMLFPRRAGIEPGQVRAWVHELVEEGCIRLYAVDGVEYLQLVNWEKHRGNTKRATTSRFPGPPTETAAGVTPGDSGHTPADLPGDPRGSAGIRGSPGDPGPKGVPSNLPRGSSDPRSGGSGSEGLGEGGSGSEGDGGVVLDSGAARSKCGAVAGSRAHALSPEKPRASESDLSPAELAQLRRQRAARWLLRPERKHRDLAAVAELAARLTDAEIAEALAAKDASEAERADSQRRARTVEGMRHEGRVARRR